MAFKRQNTSQYSTIRLCDEILVINELILKGSWIIIPKSLHREALQKIHTGHMGIEKCTERAKDCIYWPGINAYIKDMINMSSYCIDYKNQQPVKPLRNHEIPTTPWTKVWTYFTCLENPMSQSLIIQDFLICTILITVFVWQKL